MTRSTEAFSVEGMKPKYSLGLRRYQKFFKFNIPELAGKTVIDVGAAKAQFQTEALRHGIRVFSVDPAYARPEAREGLSPEGKIAAKAQALPFRSESVDVALSRRAITDKLRGAERYRAIGEMLRVVKTGGWIGIGPFIPDFGIAGLRTIRNLLRRCEFSLEQYPVTAHIPALKKKQVQYYLKIKKNGNLEKFWRLVEGIEKRQRLSNE